ncbi:DUF5666 domain-containing protein [Vibrio sp. ZSDE26]|uniref:DUF5666 domain-containing protein n=1 Tax=Vibrio amylolyticus TaxID=2847292 RepID=A0A9X1XJP6_9VIBR|nr:DUF5666 domain-containing protein [Vibrio amylolyticus]MCK6264242.1 DUF5666 domain-containing protein [Vibrio amylolyticus]
MNKSILALCVALSLTACRSSDDNQSISNSKTGKLDGQVKQLSVSNQTLNVNGYALRGSNAMVSYRDVPMTFDQLGNGMRVQADAIDNNISEMKLDPSLTGEVTYRNGNQFTVNGIDLTFDSLGQIQAGDWVMVTTYPQVDGSMDVVSVQLMPQIDFVEMEGTVTSLQDRTFRLNNVLVDYSNATVHNEYDLKNGAWVEVFGDMVANKLVASEIDVTDYSKYDGVEIEGILTWVNSDKTMIQLNNHLNVAVTDRTEFDDGKREDLAVGRWVEVELLFRDGRLVADEIEFEDDGDFAKGKEFEVEGRADYQNGVFTINGIEIEITYNTDFDDGLRPGNLDGKWVEVEGRYLSESFIAHEIEREDEDDDDIELEGPVLGDKQNPTLWGYSANDGSLDKYHGFWVDLDCDFDGTYLSDCDD